MSDGLRAAGVDVVNVGMVPTPVGYFAASVPLQLEGGELDGYQLAHAARADFCRRLGRNVEARTAYQRAIELTNQGPARRFLERRLAALPV